MWYSIIVAATFVDLMFVSWALWLALDTRKLVPEISLERRFHVQQNILDNVFGERDSVAWDERRAQARDTSQSDGQQLNVDPSNRVYGELGLDALVTILDAVGVREGDTLLDVGSGDGMLVAAAAALYPLRTVYGIEIMPSMHQRAIKYTQQVEQLASVSPMCLACGDIYNMDATVSKMVQDSYLVVCFATTWSRGIPGRKLHRLSEALASKLPEKAKVVIVDGVLNMADGWNYQGELRIQCPDTAPYSVAHLYEKMP